MTHLLPVITIFDPNQAKCPEQEGLDSMVCGSQIRKYRRVPILVFPPPGPRSADPSTPLAVSWLSAPLLPLLVCCFLSLWVCIYLFITICVLRLSCLFTS